MRDSPILRRGDAAQSGSTRQVKRLRLFTRAAALVDVVYLFGWLMILQPVMSSQLQVYNAHLDGAVRSLQVFGLAVIAAAVLGLWAAWRMFSASAPWLSRIWTIAVAAALLGVVWIAFMAHFISFSLNY